MFGEQYRQKVIFIRKTMLYGLFALISLVLLFLASCKNSTYVRDFTIDRSTISVALEQSSIVSFSVSQPASIHLFLEGEKTYALFDQESRRLYPAGDHDFTFSGIVQGYLSDNENYPFTIVQRLVPNGEYKLVLVADAEGKSVQVQQAIAIIESDTSLPAIRRFEIDPNNISPNEDGIDDAAKVIVDLAQDVELLSLYAVSPTGKSYPIPELEGQSIPNSMGVHTFHFDALEIAADQLENGVYIISADVYDHYGQHIRWDIPLNVEQVGELFGFIVDGAVTYSTSSIEIQESLCFSLKVRNNSDTFMRTTGPWSGETYGTDDNFVSLRFAEDKGVYRVGLDFDTGEGLYPYRWALGTPGVDLIKIHEDWYLPPNNDGTVSGCVQFDRIPTVNPQYAWVGLIHEQSADPLVNHRVAPHRFEIIDGTQAD